jgi:FkbM family methyltransferase
MDWRWSIARFYSRVAPTNRGTYAVARWARNGIPSAQWQAAFTTPGGLSFDLDLATYPDFSMALDLYETDTVRWLRRLLFPGAYFVDCGANLGYFALNAWRLVGTGGRVDAFEPDQLNRARLEINIRRNGAAAVVVHPLAVSSEPGEIAFYHPTGPENHGQASGYEQLVVGGQRSIVRAVRLDDVCDRVPDLIKIDIEGAELAALRGASRLIRSERPPALIIEHNPQTAQAAGYRPSDLFRYLKTEQPAYRIYWIGWRVREIVTPETLDAITRQGNLLIRCANPANRAEAKAL